MSGAVKNGKIWLDSKVTIELEGIRMPADTPRNERKGMVWTCRFCGITADSLLELYEKHKLMEDEKRKDYCRTAVPEYVEK